MSVFSARQLVLFAVLASSFACGPAGPTTTSCEIPANKTCLTATASGGTLSNITCAGTTVESCTAAGQIGRCSQNSMSNGVSITTVTYFYTGADAAAAQTDCTNQMGTWST